MSIRTCVLAVATVIALAAAALAPSTGAAFTPGSFTSHYHSKDGFHPKPKELRHPR